MRRQRMVVHTDSIDFAEKIVGRTNAAWTSATPCPSGGVEALGRRLFRDGTAHRTHLDWDLSWQHLLVVEKAPRSQYDVLIELAREQHESLPDGILCLAGTGEKFHGFRGRPWTASAGNIHLSAYLAPSRQVDHVAFTLLAAVSVIDALDTIPGLENRAGIKWVNDILIEDAKVCGVLAHTQSMQGAVIGIGLNVETRPAVEPTPFVPRVGSLGEFAPGHPEAGQGHVFRKLIHALDRNYDLLLQGRYNVLLDRYRERSVALGRKVGLCSDQAGADHEMMASGRAVSLGENLELFLEGHGRPFSRGRLILDLNTDGNVRETR